MSVSSAKIKINGTEYPLTYNSTTQKWEATVTAPGVTSFNQPGGFFACEVSATNTAGTTTTVTTSDATVGNDLKLVVKETVAPVIAIISPSSGASVTNNKPTISFTVVDEANGSGVDLSELVLSIDGNAVTGVTSTAITNGYSCSYVPPSALLDGSHTITVDAKDHDGNSASQGTTTFKVDTVPPTLNITIPAENAVAASSSVGYSGTTNDAISSPVTIAVTLDGVAQTAPTVADNGVFSGTFVGVSDGAHTAVFTATDGAGKSSEVTRHFTVDTAPPSITDVSIAPNPANTAGQMIVSVTIV